MGKIKLTKGELKRQRDALKQFQRYLPTLQLKKQQLQMEILHQIAIAEEKRRQEQVKQEMALAWAALLAEADIRAWIKPAQVVTSVRNIAGVDIAVFENAQFARPEYDLFTTALWIDAAIEQLKTLVSLRAEIRIVEQGITVLKQELRITTQRVNLFEKVKIPQSQEAIRRIKIYLGDQTANAVGRSKIAKRKIEAYELQGAAA